MFTLNPEILKRKFSVEEDCILMAAIKEYGVNFHKFPSNLLPGRTKVQIRNRYNNVLRYVGLAKCWSAEDDEALMSFCEKHGTKNWSKVAEEIKSHTRLSCRSRYYTIVRFLEQNPNKSVKDCPRKAKSFSSTVNEDNWMETIIRVKTEASQTQHLDRDKKYKPPPGTKCGMDFFNYFKYSFGYKMKPIEHRSEKTTHNTQAVCQLLNTKVCPVTYKMLQSFKPATMDLHFLDFNSTFSFGITIPSNWNTALLLRGMNIMFQHPQDDDNKLVVQKFECKNALDLFKRRFEALLFNALLVSKLDFTTFETDIASTVDEPEDNVEIYNGLEADPTPISNNSQENESLQTVENYENPSSSFNYTLETTEGNYEISVLERTKKTYARKRKNTKPTLIDINTKRKKI